MAKESSVPGTVNWARFDDLLESGFGRATDSVVLANSLDYSTPASSGFSETQAVFSFLVDPEKVPLDEIFSSPFSEFRSDFEALTDEPCGDGEKYVDPLHDSNFQPIVQFRNGVGDYPSEWRIWPALEDYFNLRRDQAGNLVDPYTGTLVVAIPGNADQGPLTIRTDYLREYLAARRMFLVRQHDYRRWWEQPIEGLGQIADYGSEIRTDWGCYVLNTINDVYPAPPGFSRLVAKDAVPPHDSRGRVGGRHRKPPKPSDCPEFIVRRNLSGELETMRPSERDLGPPVFFDPKVLKRYYDQPSLYSVGFSAPGLGGASGPTWSIPLGRNSEGFILAWLGDFLKKGLPIEEIQHWRASNIEPRGGMAEDFWQAQMQCRPPGQPSLESRLLNLRYHLREGVKGRGHAVYRVYEGPDRHAEKCLREPLYDEHPEFHEAIRLVTIVLIEYLDVGTMKGQLGEDRRKDQHGKSLGSIVILSNWLEDVLGVPHEVTHELRTSLQRLQAVRSRISGSHRFSDEGYQKALRKLHLETGASAREIYRAVAEPIADSLERVCVELGLRDEIWWLRKRSGEGTP